MSKEKRSFLQKMFDKTGRENTAQYSWVQMLNGQVPMFYTWGENPYQADIVRGAVDAIARNAAKLKPVHIRRIGKNVQPIEDQMTKVLQVRPNDHMDTYTFLYKVVTTLFVDNNAFIYPQWVGGQLAALWPINCNRAEFVEDDTKTLFIRFWFAAGQSVVLPYTDVIHLRRHFYKSDLLGETNTPINTMLGAIKTTNEGIGQAITASLGLRGILKYQGILKDSDIQAQTQKFMKNFMTIGNAGGGVAGVDSKTDYVPLKEDIRIINAAQMREMRDTVYRYFGVSEKIVMNTYNEDEWNAFYEGLIEPVAIQMSLEFTSKLFSPGEQGRGQEIMFEANRLQYASATTKITLLKDLAPLGLFTINEGREILNLPMVEGGDKRLVSLNFVNADQQDKYQVGDDNDPSKTEGGDEDGQE